MRSYTIWAVLGLVAILTGIYFYSSTTEVVQTPIVITKNLAEDIYPLYSNLSWGSEHQKIFETFSGYEVISTPIVNISDLSAVSVPFDTYYRNKLRAAGWVEDSSLAAGGPGSEITAYRKGQGLIITSFHTDFKGGATNEPVQCPCDITFSVFSK
jgi:hypothetical protein